MSLKKWRLIQIDRNSLKFCTACDYALLLQGQELDYELENPAIIDFLQIISARHRHKLIFKDGKMKLEKKVGLK